VRGDDLVERGLQRDEVQPTGDLNRLAEHVRRASWLELVEKPHALLHRGEWHPGTRDPVGNPGRLCPAGQSPAGHQFPDQPFAVGLGGAHS